MQKLWRAGYEWIEPMWLLWEFKMTDTPHTAQQLGHYRGPRVDLPEYEDADMFEVLRRLGDLAGELKPFSLRAHLTQRPGT